MLLTTFIISLPLFFLFYIIKSRVLLSNYLVPVLGTCFLYGLLPELCKVLISGVPDISLDMVPPAGIESSILFASYFILVILGCRYILPNTLFLRLAKSFWSARHALSRSRLLSSLILATSMLLIFLSLLYFTSNPSFLDLWLNDFSNSYIKLRRGYGLILMWLPILTRFLAFLVGARLSALHRSDYPLITLSFIALICGIFLSGFKSSFIFAIVFLFSSFFFLSRISLTRTIVLLFSSVILIVIGNYVRSNGYYNGFKTIEYLPHYFNTLELHDLLSASPSIEKNINSLTGLTSFLDYAFGNSVAMQERNISNQLSAVFFPLQWEDGGTQQWPIFSSLSLVYGRFPLMWLPSILAFIFFVRFVLLKGTSSTRLSFYWHFLYLNEYVRFFSVYRSSHFDFDLIVFSWIPYSVLFVFVFVLSRFFPLGHLEKSEIVESMASPAIATISDSD